jgi:hypothetical protein
MCWFSDVVLLEFKSSCSKQGSKANGYDVGIEMVYSCIILETLVEIVDLLY